MNIITPQFSTIVGINDLTLCKDSQDTNIINASITGYIDICHQDRSTFSKNTKHQSISDDFKGVTSILIPESTVTHNEEQILNSFAVSKDTAAAAAHLFALGFHSQAMYILNK